MHADHRTAAASTDYFLFGRDSLTVAVQWCRSGDLSPYGILLWRADRFARKESTLLFHPERGLAGTMASLRLDGVRVHPTHESTRVEWESHAPDHPIVRVTWLAGPIVVVERFFLAPRSSAIDDISPLILHRTLALRSADGARHDGDIVVGLLPNPYLFDGLPTTQASPPSLKSEGYESLHLFYHGDADAFERFVTAPFSASTDEWEVLALTYRIGGDTDASITSIAHDNAITTIEEREAGDDDVPARLIRQIDISRIGIAAAVARDGRFDASLWQYGYEWAQDAAAVAMAACYAGDVAPAERIVENILARLTNDRGSVAESSRFRDGELAELNANGSVLTAVALLHTVRPSTTLVERYRERIIAVGDRLLSAEHLHPSGLLVGRRDIWERLPWMGVETGVDIATTALSAEGLIAGAQVMKMVGEEKRADRWREAGERMREAMLSHESLSLIDDGRFIHRRLIDGSVQRTMTGSVDYHDRRYAPYLPGTDDSDERLCDPDASSVLPILCDLIDPASPIVRATLDVIHAELWSPTGIGGYARSAIASDPDSPGPWPFATAWVAEAELRAGLTDRARASTAWLLDRAGAGGSWLEYYGDRSAPGTPPIGIIVWGWAQFLLLAIRGWMGVRIDHHAVTIAPRIAPFMHSLTIGDHTITIEARGLERAAVDGAPIDDTSRPPVVILPLPLERDHRVEFD